MGSYYFDSCHVMGTVFAETDLLCLVMGQGIKRALQAQLLKVI